MRHMAVSGWLVLLAQPAVAQVTYEGSLSGLTGYYLFTERTNSLILTNGLTVRSGRLSVSASWPLWYQNTTLLTSSGGGGIPTGGSSGQGTVRDSGQGHGGSGGQGGATGSEGAERPSGGAIGFAQGDIPAPPEAITGYQLMVGDPLAQVNIGLTGGGRVLASVGATAKFPVASTTTIGTGQWDYAGQASVSVMAGSRWTVGLTGSYWHLGDLDSLDLQDPLAGSLTVGRLVGYDWAVSLWVAASTATLEGFDPPVTVSGSLTRLRAGGAWGINAGVGFTETAPDFSVGAAWWFTLSRPPPPQ
jgi:hypothetical protein